MRKRAIETIWRDESGTGNKNKLEGVVQKLLVFFEENLNKIANLDQKIRSFYILDYIFFFCSQENSVS